MGRQKDARISSATFLPEDEACPYELTHVKEEILAFKFKILHSRLA
jgi:hypothetical protein